MTNAERPPLRRSAYATVLADLRAAYDRSADERDRAPLADWKLAERARVLAWLRAGGARTLLESGAGAGKDALFFQRHGLDVTTTDQSPAMVAHCRRKGLRAERLDVLSLSALPDRYDAVYALNCLLHVPRADLPTALVTIAAVLRPGGLFYLGLYGGRDSESVWPDDQHNPSRFFSFHTDDGLVTAVQAVFAVEAAACPLIERGEDLHFQSLLLQRPRRSSAEETAACVRRS